MNIDEAIGRFHDYIATERRMAGGTVRNYTDDLNDLARYLKENGIEALDDLAARDIRAWQMLHTERGEVPGTIRRRLSSVRSWLRYLRRQGFLDADLMAKITPPKRPRKLPVFFREAEVEHLYDEGLFADDFYGLRDKLLLRMLYETGMRRSEIAALTEAGIDLGGLSLKVLGKRNKERLIPIEPELARQIAEYLEQKRQVAAGCDSLFVGRKGQPLSGSQVYTIVRRYMTALSTADRISPHVFRHSFATHMLNEGASIQAIKELLGHTELATTEVYTHVTREHLKSEYSHAHPRSRKQN